MSRAKRYARKQAKARQRCRQTAQQRLERDRRQAQQAAEALHQALDKLGLPDGLAREIEGRLRSQQTLLGKIIGVMFPALFGCRTPSARCRVRGWDKNWPSRLLRALPQRSWLKRLRGLGLDVLAPLWRHIENKSEATRSRWQWTWAVDDSVFRKYGAQLGLVGSWWSGQHHRVLSGIDGLLLVVVIGDGKLVVPVDFAIRRPTHGGPGAPCRDKLNWARTMIDGRLDAFQKRGLELPPAMITADSWFSDSKLMSYVRDQHHGTLLVEGKDAYSFTLADGRHVHGRDFLKSQWPWRYHPWEQGVRYVRLQAQSPTYGAVTVVIVNEAGQDRFYLLRLQTELSGPVLIRRWRRRHWIEFAFRVLKHLLATDACQSHTEDAYYGHFVLRLMGSFVLFYPSRVICQGRLTMEAIIFSLKHYWRFVDFEQLELQALS